MQVFISWSGPVTSDLGTALKRFLDTTFAGHVQTFLSAENIAPGERFQEVIAESLQTATLGILLVTPTNQTSPWLLFEAGALALKADHGSVVPILVGLERADLLSPLNQFQNARGAERVEFEQICELIRSSTAMPVEAFQTLFEAGWPDMERAFARATEQAGRATEAGTEPTPSRSVDDMVREILVSVTDLSRFIGPALRDAGGRFRDLARENARNVAPVAAGLVGSGSLTIGDLSDGRSMVALRVDELPGPALTIQIADLARASGTILRLNHGDESLTFHPAGTLEHHESLLRAPGED